MRRLAFFCGLMIAACAWGQTPAAPASVPGSTPSSTPNSAPASGVAGGPQINLQQALAAATKRLAARGAELEKLIQGADAGLKELDDHPEDPQRAVKKEKLTALRGSYQEELTFLQNAVNSLQSAGESQESAARFRQELEEFRARKQTTPPSAAALAALEAQLAQVQATKTLIDQLMASRGQRLEAVRNEIAAQPQDAAPLLLAERDALAAQIDAAQFSSMAVDAQIELLQAKIDAAQAAGATVVAAASQPAPTTQAANRQSAEEKQKIAERLAKEARDDLEDAKYELERIREQLAAAGPGEDTRMLENNREYWSRKLEYEKRRVIQASMEKRAASEKRAAAQIEEQIAAAEAGLKELQSTVDGMAPHDRKRQAEDLRSRAEKELDQADAIKRRVESERPSADLWVKQMRSIETLSAAMQERAGTALQLWNEGDDYGRLEYDWVKRMERQLDIERQQVNALMNISEVASFALLRQATLRRQLARVYNETADLLAPPLPSFWERQRRTIDSIKIILTALVAAWAVKLAIFFIQRAARSLATGIAKGRFSVKRIETLLGFGGSIVKVFIWIFALIMVLMEFGIDPAKSTGAIGLVGLILAGMFQQVVIDVVKGLDIITGRHYNIGDFVELDGKSGHVIDFSMTHTRIRTASGQEYNLPNSKCIPSRRFPDGYVDNYVDFAIRSSGDVHAARKALVAVCRHLRRRVEQVKDELVLADRFRGPQPGSVMLRYRVRVLPACEWVITRQFIPVAKAALAAAGVELVEEPTFFFLNRISTFRQLFSRELSEEEILREAAESERLPEPEAQPAALPAAGPHETVASATK